MNTEYTYGFLDSGVGGLPYLEELEKEEPNASCAYLADNLHFPYGEKTTKEICQFACEATDLLIKKAHPKIIVVACNTISVVALESLRNSFDIPFVGTVPAIKKAVSCSKKHKIGLLATKQTISSPYTANLISQFAYDCEVFFRADSKLISFIEHNNLKATPHERFLAIKPAIDEFRTKGVDSIVLACTHFLQFASDFKDAAPDMYIVDSREGVIHQARRIVNKITDEGQTSEFLLKEGQTSKKRSILFCTSPETKESSFKDFAKSYSAKWGGTIG